MSKKRDPVIAVLKYFQEADLGLAHQALALAQQTLRARAASPPPRLVAKKPAAATPPAPAGPPRAAAGGESR